MFSIFSFVARYKSIFLILIAILPLTYLYFDYTNSKDAVLRLSTENAQLTEKVDEAENLIKEILTEQERLANQFRVISDSFNRIRNENIQLSRRIRSVVSNTADKNSVSEIEQSINNISNNMNRCFEILSGSTLTEEEKNASTPEEFNTECPYLFPSE